MNKELNKRIRKLPNRYQDYIHSGMYEDWQGYRSFVEEFKACYEEAGDFEQLSKRSVLILIRVNLSMRIIPFHYFGNKISL